jgi:hypothetical protein
MDCRPAALAVATATSYIAFVAILIWQALRGVSIASFDVATLTALVIWATASAGVLVYIFAADASQPSALPGSTV